MSEEGSGRAEETRPREWRAGGEEVVEKGAVCGSDRGVLNETKFAWVRIRRRCSVPCRF